MKLDSRTPKVNVPLYVNPFNWSEKTDSSIDDPDWQASTWVQLQELPSPYSHDEALLLCQHSETEWVVWIPEYGEMILHRSQLGRSR